MRGHKFWWQNKSMANKSSSFFLLTSPSLYQTAEAWQRLYEPGEGFSYWGRTWRGGPRLYWRFDPFFLSASFSNDLAVWTFMPPPLSSLPVIGWASLVSNLCHLDECVPPPFMLRWPFPLHYQPQCATWILAGGTSICNKTHSLNYVQQNNLITRITVGEKSCIHQTCAGCMSTNI